MLQPNQFQNNVFAMLDIETLGTRPDARIVQISVQAFRINSDETFPIANWNVHPFSKQNGASVDSETFNWWSEQDPDVCWQVMSGGDTLEYALHGLNDYLKEAGVTMVVANSPSFDCVIVENAYRRMGIPNKMPKFYNWIDLRTILKMADKKLPTATHNAVDDVIAQIKTMREAMDVLWKKTETTSS